jgi:hypothetical protein
VSLLLLLLLLLSLLQDLSCQIMRFLLLWVKSAAALATTLNHLQPTQQVQAGARIVLVVSVRLQLANALHLQQQVNSLGLCGSGSEG